MPKSYSWTVTSSLRHAGQGMSHRRSQAVKQHAQEDRPHLLGREVGFAAAAGQRLQPPAPMAFIEMLPERIRLSHVIVRPHGCRLARHAVEDDAVDRALLVAHELRSSHGGEPPGTLRGNPIYEGAVVSVQRNLPFGHTSPGRSIPRLVLSGDRLEVRKHFARSGCGKELARSVPALPIGGALPRSRELSHQARELSIAKSRSRYSVNSARRISAIWARRTGAWSVAVCQTRGQWMPKYSCTRMFRTMSGQGTELYRDVTSELNRATASPMIVSFLGDGVAQRLVGQEFSLCPSCDRLRDPIQCFQDVVQTLLITPHRSTEPRPARRAG